jgi:transcriptional regulator of heat shock response
VLALVGLSTENHLYFAGLTSLGQRTEPEIFCDIAHFLEETEKDFEQFFSLSYDYEVPSIFIGKEHPFLRGTRCGLIVSRYPSRFNEGFIGLLGPNRMDYGRNLSLLEYVNQLFESL